jgi:hypothetical protein
LLRKKKTSPASNAPPMKHPTAAPAIAPESLRLGVPVAPGVVGLVEILEELVDDPFKVMETMYCVVYGTGALCPGTVEYPTTSYTIGTTLGPGAAAMMVVTAPSITMTVLLVAAAPTAVLAAAARSPPSS